MNTHPGSEPGWESGWEEHGLAQRRRFAALSLIDKLAWLEEAQRLAEFMLKRPVRKSDPERGGGEAG